MNARPSVLPYGPTAALLEVAGTTVAAALAAHLRALRAAGRIEAVDVVPAARTVLVRCETREHLDGVLDEIDGFEPQDVRAEVTPIVEIPVRYDGGDLDQIAASTGLTVDEVVRRHSGATYVAAFSGFAPGFTYLVGLDPALHLPRRRTPRPRIPAGSVGIGGEFAGVYPTVSPGGWHLLGSTDAVLWDVDRAEPALIPPGCRVRFVPTARA